MDLSLTAVLSDLGLPLFLVLGIVAAGSYVDGNWVDILSFLTAISYTGIKWAKRPKSTRGAFLCRDMGVEFVNAGSLFPLFLLTCSILSSKFTEALLSGNKITLSIAGGFALFALLEDRKQKGVLDVPSAVNAVGDKVGPAQGEAANSPMVVAQAAQKPRPRQQQRNRGKGRRR